jgi:hypothetical protein
MFEQSVLLDSSAGKKAGALAAPLTLQALGVGTLPVVLRMKSPETRQ